MILYIHELRFAGLHASDTVVVALSGGVDSMALCHLASQVIACNRPCCPRCIPPVLLQPVWKFSKLATFMHTRMLTNTQTRLQHFDTVHAVTVDHGLRPESSVEAEEVCASWFHCFPNLSFSVSAACRAGRTMESWLICDYPS